MIYQSKKSRGEYPLINATEHKFDGRVVGAQTEASNGLSKGTPLYSCGQLFVDGETVNQRFARTNFKMEPHV